MVKIFDRKLGLEEYELIHKITSALMALQDLDIILKNINMASTLQRDEQEHLAFAMNNQIEYLERKIYNYQVLMTF